MQIRKLLVLAVPVIASFALVACTGDDGSEGGGGGAGTSPTATSPVATAPANGGDTPVSDGTATGTPGTPGAPVATPDADGNAPAPVAPDGRRLEVAPIEGLELLVRESFPPQYAAVVKSGLPSGCAEFAGIQVERDGDVFTLTVWNTMPSDPNVACTMIYGITEHSVTLGGEFEAGVTYTVRAGDVEATFTAQ